MVLTRIDILKILDEKGIEYREVFHKAVHTIAEASMLSIPDFEFSRVPKNLFLRDDKKRSYYLVSIDSEKRADLKSLRSAIGSRPLSFASDEDLYHILSLEQGSVTPFGLLADEERKVTAIFDSVFKEGIIGIHPMENTSTVFLDSAALFSLITEHENKIIFI